MNYFKLIFTLLLLVASTSNYAQLGFCNGSKGEAIFSENFGNGTNYGPALPAGITNYNFINGAPNDGQYTLFYRTNMYSTWHYSLDHTPDATNGTNGKALLMNANASTTGDFYKRTVSGLCVNTTFEFSAWLMNVYNPGSGFCGAGEIPINVRFEIWNDTETVLLGSGNTGNIIGTSTPIWQQFALVFTTVNQTSVVLKMKNNGLGGCGNDLAIDDIEFRSCGDLTTITSPPLAGNSYSTCNSPISVPLQATTSGASAHFYQWQASTDGTTWSDISGANLPTYTTPNLATQTYFRAKVSQDIANLSNNFCSTLSDVFTVSFLNIPNNTQSTGDKTICSNDAIPTLTVTSDPNTSVDWFDAPSGGILVQSNSNSYTPTGAGTFYAETYNLSSNCRSSGRTAVTLTILALPTATISANDASVCANGSSVLNFSGTPNAIITYSVNGINQTITLNGSGFGTAATGNLITHTTFQLITAHYSGSVNCTTTLSNAVTITINAGPIANFIGAMEYCSNETTAINLISNMAGTTFSWTVAQNGTTGASSGNGTQISQTLAATNLDGTATYYVTPYYNGCVGTVLVIICTVHPLPVPTIVDGTICLNASSTPSSQYYTLDTNLSAANYSFQWFLGTLPIANSGSTYNAFQVGTYAVIATNISTGCISNQVFATVSQSAQGQSLVIDQSEMFSDATTITINVNGGTGPFSYQLDASAFQNSNIFTNVTAGNHTITVVDATFCTNLYTTVTVINYPHFFTPNGDGVNDSWNIRGLREDSKVFIFDRFGKLIKQIFTNGAGWDGIYNGELMFSDDYWFTLEYLDTTSLPKTFKAHFALIR